jgi:hypothetical protein
MSHRNTAPDRRTLDRRTCAVEAPFRLGNHIGTLQVRDLSTGGVGLVVPRAVAPGHTLSVELPEPDGTTWHLKVLQVVHATARPDQSWLVGSVFQRALTAPELDLLAPGAA